jgi:hypothetical protein
MLININFRGRCAGWAVPGAFLFVQENMQLMNESQTIDFKALELARSPAHPHMTLNACLLSHESSLRPQTQDWSEENFISAKAHDKFSQ